MRVYRSWGRYPRARHAGVLPVLWRAEPPPLDRVNHTVLPFACGRSYGDSCLNDGGLLLDTAGINGLIAFESRRHAPLRGGVTLADILALTVLVRDGREVREMLSCHARVGYLTNGAPKEADRKSTRLNSSH